VSEGCARNRANAPDPGTHAPTSPERKEAVSAAAMGRTWDGPEMRMFDRLKGDWIYLRGAVRALRLTTPIAKHPTRVFPDVIEELADRYGERTALLSDRETFSYRVLLERSNRYSRWALAHGLRKGESVCLLMPNRPEYMAVWLGITRAGGAVSLLNTYLVGPSLAYCIDIVAPQHIIVAAELVAAFSTAERYLKTKPRIWAHGEGAHNFARIEREIEQLSGDNLKTDERPRLTIEDKALYIYTSGTTGLPKAANINHYRLMLASYAFAGVMDTRASDRMYDCLPMYHTTGGVLATGAVLIAGGSVAIREKFSAREFWDDIVRFDCTLFQYIGELCRYLVNTPPSPKEKAHRLRLCCGNGLRPDVWLEFKTRFNIPKILEFYAATEGNVNLFNFEGVVGSVGRIPWFLARRFPTRIVKFDPDKQQPARDARGFCVPCAANEVGETIGQILNDASKPGNRFEGYADDTENEKKILRDVFVRGDAWFRTGDLMRQDADGFFYFIDRVGDTFRWKGENVSTTEVAETINLFHGVSETTVYGVQVPGYDGRAGMAAIVCSEPIDLAALRMHIMQRLPEYARPLFLRIRGEIEVTATFKQKKIDLVKQGFDPTKTSDPLYFNDPQSQAFVRLDKTLYDCIVSGEVKITGPREAGAVKPAPSEVLAFWRAAGPDKWFDADDALDAEIRARFLPTYELAAAGLLTAWELSAEGALALAIVLDQFPRNMFRGSGRAFAADAMARTVADRAITAGFDRSFSFPERRFFYLPFLHSENLADQERSIALFKAAGDQDGLAYAQTHADVIRRFKRFPHRNEALGRATTPDERAFLEGGGFAA
jgi:fatty-acyl-CoA synthase